MSALRELLARFQIAVDSKELKEGHKAVEEFKENLKEAGKVALEVFGLEKVREFINEQVELGARTADLSERLGVAAKDLQAFQFAAQLGGVEAESAAHSLGKLNKTIGEALTGGSEAAQVFTKLGIAFKAPGGGARDVNDVLLDISEALEKLPSQQERAAYAMKLFGREGQSLLPVLGHGRKELAATLEEFRALGGGMSDDFIKKAKEADDETKKWQVGLQGLKAEIVGALLPGMIETRKWMQEVIVRVRQFTKDTSVLKTGIDAVKLGILVKGLTQVSKALGPLKGGVLGVVRALAGFALPAVAVGLLYLAFDELYNLLKGNDTLIGRALGPDKAQFVFELRGAVDELSGAFSSLDQATGGSGTALGGFAVIVVGLGKALAFVVEMIAAVVDGLGKISEPIADLLGGRTDRAIAGFKDIGSQDNYNKDKYDKEQDDAIRRQSSVDDASYRRDNIARLLAKRTQAIQANKAYEKGQFTGPPPAVPSEGALMPASAPPAYLMRPTPNWVESGAGGGPVTINQTNNTNVEVHAPGASDPEGVGSAVTQGVSTSQQRNNAKALTARTKP